MNEGRLVGDFHVSNPTTVSGPNKGRRLAYYAFDANVSRLLEILVASCAIMVLLPVIVLICAAIVAHDGRSPIFVHYRIGRSGRKFPCLKLRTMVMDADHRLRLLLESDAAARSEWMIDQKLRNDPRITQTGPDQRVEIVAEIADGIFVVDDIHARTVLGTHGRTAPQHGSARKRQA